MVHRLRHNKPDWADIAPESWNSWQRLAARTHGYATPANMVTLLGFILSITGIVSVYENRLLLGVILLLVGRLADVLDGFVAALTGTKSRVGEFLDASSDKLVAGTGLVVFITKGTIPLLPVVVILTQNTLNVALSLTARFRGRELHPSRAGKQATVLQWLVLLSFIAARLVSPHSVFVADILNAIGYLGLLLFLVPAVDASIGYVRHAMGLKPAKSYTDNEGGSHRTLGRLLRAYWRKKWLVALSALPTLLIMLVIYSLAASPYSSDSFVQSPFTTTYEHGHVVLTQHFTPHVYSGWLASVFGTYGIQMETDIWDRLRSPKEPAGNFQSITAAIYAQRFDPSKPYIISGDQFDGFYFRSLGVFYQDLLNPHTAVGTADWHNQERIAVQSLAYGLAATQQLKYPVTTLLPVSPRGVVALNFWNYPSDTVFSLFDMLQMLKNDPATRQAALQLQREYGSGLQAAYQNYLTTVRDPKTGLVRSNIRLSSARDAVRRQSSFYDNVILWRTQQLATQLGFAKVSASTLAVLRQIILQRYWNDTAGHFIDDAAPGDGNSYSSDWLIALPVGFLNSANPADRQKLIRISAYIDKEHLTSPLPIRYTTDTDKTHQDIFVRVFVGSYGNTAVWSYWGDLYITLETDLYQQTGRALYAQHVTSSLAAWRRVVVRDRGYPETLDAHGNILKTPDYESIRRNGWIVDFESDEYHWNQLTAGSKP